MELHLRLEGRGNLARQLHRQLREAIVAGRLRNGERMPPTRELADSLEVSRNTVTLAYDWLRAEGFVRGEAGAGTFVRSPGARAPKRRSGATLPVRELAATMATPSPREVAPEYDFGVGSPDASRFPYADWRRFLARQMRESRMTGDYGDPSGHPRLREAIAHHVAVSRGVVAEASDVVVTHGAQQAFDFVARLFVGRRTCVALEEPGYPPVRRLFELSGAAVACVDVDAGGLRVDALPDNASVVYVTPSHQFPLGMPMPHERRVALLAWAERRNAVIVEDDYDSEFRFGGRPLETLHSLDQSGRVIYVGSFSKSLLPSLRLGFLIAPRSLRRALSGVSWISSGFAQWPAQAALASMIESGLLARHVRRMRREYATRHAHIRATLDDDFSDWLEPLPAVTGMHLAARLRSGGLRFERELSNRAEAVGVGFDRLSTYYAMTPAHAGVVLGYGSIPLSKIEKGLQRLRSCFGC